MKVAKAQIRWLTPKEGGRKYPYKGATYAALVHFADGPVDWMKEAWTLVVHFEDAGNGRQPRPARVRYLFETAPEHLIRCGSRFELFEGPHKTAEGQVVSEPADVSWEPVDSALVP